MDALSSETQLPSSDEPLDPRVLQLHPQSDASLVIKSAAGDSVKFNVSSQVLMIASPYFAQLCGSKFTEGQSILRKEHPEINLEEDEPDAMEIILSILHHKPYDENEALEPQLLASVARHCDKYQCGKVLQPWASQWFLQVRSPANADEYGLLLSAAYLLKSTANFRSISAKIVRDLDIDFDLAWSDHSLTSRLPQRLRDALAQTISTVLEGMHVTLQAVEGRLQDQKTAYDMPFRLCPLCGRLHPANANQCRPCHNTDLRDATCTHGSRIAEFFACLRSSGLWPSVHPFRTRAAAVIAAQIADARNGLKHRCHAGLNCPLILEFVRLSKRASSIVSDIQGFNIEGSEDDITSSPTGI